MEGSEARLPSRAAVTTWRNHSPEPEAEISSRPASISFACARSGWVSGSESNTHQNFLPSSRVAGTTENRIAEFEYHFDESGWLSQATSGGRTAGSIMTVISAGALRFPAPSSETALMRHTPGARSREVRPSITGL